MPDAPNLARRALTPAHYETIHIAITQWIPEHGTREDDPAYVLFNRARKRLKDAGKLVCWRCGAKDHSCGGDVSIQIHHDVVEWCAAGAVDLAKFQHHFPELMPECTQEAFDAAIESEKGTLPLCQPCHTGRGTGIHYVPYPIWLQGAYFKDGLPPPSQPAVVAVTHTERITDGHQ